MVNIDILITALDYIETHLGENLKTADIASACHCSKSALEKMFQYVYAISVHSYIIRRRMMLAARNISRYPDMSILSVALEYGYSSHEAFSRAFRTIWNCSPSEFRRRKFFELYPRLREPIKEGDTYIMERKSVDISQLYDLFIERRDCYFVCCDIKSLIPINNISRKAGDLAILETLQRMNDAAGEEDIAFRIGGDEFCILTANPDRAYAESVASRIRSRNGECFSYEGREIPLYLYVTTSKPGGTNIKYNELFTQLHQAIREVKPEEP